VDRASIYQHQKADTYFHSVNSVLQRRRDFGNRKLVGSQSEQAQLKANNINERKIGANDAVENRTGLSDSLKEGLESLSGMELSGVRVHRNASQPARVNALAYTQGLNIYLGPGQEKHLPHEGWHVIQQMQGRVKPTDQVDDMSINDDVHLEQEADQMGVKAMQKAPLNKNSSAETFTNNKAIDLHTNSAAPEASALMQKKGVVQFQDPAPSRPPPQRGSIRMGGVDLRRVNSSAVSLFLGYLQILAMQRRGSGLLSGSEMASISGSGVGASLSTFLNDRSSVENGTFDSGWVDDNGSSRFFNAWDYAMRVQIPSIYFVSPTPTGRTGQHGSGSTSGSTRLVTDSNTQAVNTSVTGGAGAEVSAGGHEGAVGGGGNVSGSATRGQTDTQSSTAATGRSGNETFSRGQQNFNRYNAVVFASVVLSFRPKTTIGFENVHLRSQTLNGEAAFGFITFDYTDI